MQPLGFSYVRSNLEMDNSLKWVLFNIVIGQITSEGEIFLLRM